MKKLQKMTRNQSKTLKEAGIVDAHLNYYVERFTTEKAVLVHKETHQVKEVVFNG